MESELSIKTITTLADFHLKNNRFLTNQDIEKLGHVFVFSSLDYCNSVFSQKSARHQARSSSRRLALPCVNLC